MSRPTALVVEDSPEFARVAASLLETEGFRVVQADDGAAGVEAARRHDPEVVLLDISLPQMDGLEVCRRIREFSDCYVVMVTGRSDEFDRVLGLTIGADDYVTKPFSPRELSARIRAMRRRPRVHVAETDLRRFGPLTLDPEAREVRLHGEVVDLTRTEYDILEALSGAPRRTFSRDQLMAAVWGPNWVGDDHVISVHLGNLRRKLGESAGDGGHIRTVRGYGYRFEPADPTASTAAAVG